MKAVLNSVNALWRKAEREAYRSYHAISKEHKADHFFNFCVTAHSLRDFFFEQQVIPREPARTAYYSLWTVEPLLVAVEEIANLSKHFQLRDRKTQQPRKPKTRHLVHKPGTTFHVYVTPSGAITTIPRPSREILITASDGSRHELWSFQIDVLEYWREFLNAHGIRVRRQTVSQMSDRGTGV
jgi:hypothetical protein